MLLIEKQALVQVLIRESARALATNKGRQVSYFLVSILQVCVCKIASIGRNKRYLQNC